MKKYLITSAILQTCFVAVVMGQTAVPTFHSLGIYWSPSGGDTTIACSVDYRKTGNTQWNQVLELWFDTVDQEYRGSIVHLESDTEYDIKLLLSDLSDSASFNATTWSENFPVSDTVFLPTTSNQTYVINQSGTAGGYVLYTHAEGDSAVIDVDDNYDHCVEIADGTSYIILRGATLRAASTHGIKIFDNCNDIVIEQCDISGWGKTDNSGWGLNYESAIYSDYTSANIERVIIQCNKMHHPRTDANSWAEERFYSGDSTFHPIGAQAISMFNTVGNHVIRYNEAYSDTGHYFNDVFGGGSNYSFRGFPNRDSDIYGNKISHCWDDGIESEGANMNVRIWGNYIDSTYAKIAIASTSKGPLYIWKNIAGNSRRSGIINTSDDYERGPFIKCGGKVMNNTWYGSGRTYVFHNTVLQNDPEQGQTYPLGCSYGMAASGGILYDMIGRNNIFTTYKNWWPVLNFDDSLLSCESDFDYDLYNGYIYYECMSNPHESNGIQLPDTLLPVYDSGNGPGEFALQTNAQGFDDGVVIKNFNDNYSGTAPDIGAFEAGEAPMLFGTEACVLINTGVRTSVPANDKVKIFPNPSNGTFIILAPAAGTYRLMDGVGREVATGKLNTKQVQTNMPADVYFVVITLGDQTIYRKLVFTK
ncbi:MAG: T9SS type A sorting domain-containing protein [Lutibacter sp.]|nr:T9SS type A sorting domain-containing protein [Lutibacter sp.]